MRIWIRSGAVLVVGLLLGAAPGSALQRLARDTRVALGASLQAPVAISIDGPTPALAEGFEALFAAELSGAKLAPVVVAAGPDAERLARAAGTRSLARIHLSLEGPDLVARVDVIGTWVNFWSGTTPTRPPSPAAVNVVRVSADGAAKDLATGAQGTPAMAPPRPVAALRFELDAQPLASLPTAISALTAADLTGDRKPELLVLTENELLVFTAAGQVLASHELKAVPSAKFPTRDAAGILTAGGTPLKVGFLEGKHEQGEWLAFEPGANPTPAGFQLLSAAGAIPCGPSADKLVAERVPGQSTVRVRRLDPPVKVADEVTTCAGFERGPLSSTVLVFPDGSGTWDGHRMFSLGAGVTLLEVPGQERPWLLSSAPQFDPGFDSLRVFADAQSPGRDVGLRVRGRVLQLVAVDLENDGMEELVLGVREPDGHSTLRLARQVKP